MRWAPLLALALWGCGAPRNTSPVSYGVPDGMVLGRDVVGASAVARAEVVTFARADEKSKAYVWTPLPAVGKPVRVEYAEKLAWPKSPGRNEILVIVEGREDVPGMKEAVAALAASLRD